MSKIKLTDGTILNPINIDGTESNYQTNILYNGMSRDSLTLHFDPQKHTFEQLNTMFSDSARTSTISILIPETVQGADAEGQPTSTEIEKEIPYIDYSLKVSVALQSIETTRATADTPATVEERYVVTMAQLSYLEKQIKNQQTVIDDILVSMVEV